MTLNEARTRRKLTQAQLADRARVDQKTISNLETGRVQDPSHRIVVRICRVLGVSTVKGDEIDEFKVNGR